MRQFGISMQFKTLFMSNEEKHDQCQVCHVMLTWGLRELALRPPIGLRSSKCSKLVLVMYS